VKSYRKEVLMRLVLKLLPMVLALMLVLPVSASTRQHHYTVPEKFRQESTCVHMHEEHWSWRWSPYFHPYYSIWNGYWTGMQFAGSTWARANRLLGRRDNPATASRLNVMLHALVIVREDGGSWREWRGTADHYCGLPVY
jgi:hypothetical protein